MITYVDKTSKNIFSNNHVVVKLDGKSIGKIIQVDNGFQYFPNNSKNGGEIYPNVNDVKQSLEAE